MHRESFSLAALDQWLVGKRECSMDFDGSATNLDCLQIAPAIIMDSWGSRASRAGKSLQVHESGWVPYLASSDPRRSRCRFGLRESRQR
jgi:hypothetical protein